MTTIAIVEEMKTILAESLHESKLKDNLNKQMSKEKKTCAVCGRQLLEDDKNER